MKLKPVNKFLLIERIEEKKVEERPFYVPEATLVQKRNIVVKLLDVSEGSPYEKYIGCNLVVLAGMSETVEVGDEKFLVISENGVQGILQESDLFS